jgi:hypothetical protein
MTKLNLNAAFVKELSIRITRNLGLITKPIGINLILKEKWKNNLI